MKTGLIVSGVVFLVLGLVAYLLPTQTAAATITTVGDGDTDTRTSYTTYAIPWQFSLAFVAIGGVLFIIGAFIPDVTPESLDETKEKVVSGKGKQRKILREEHHIHRTHAH
ncbi:hypothetical protein HY492_00415 [Candidatus Woesearchaeota archaeon]|nr:hypothetical protein [Candidatus Woesearchaeota archaeon]